MSLHHGMRVNTIRSLTVDAKDFLDKTGRKRRGVFVYYDISHVSAKHVAYDAIMAAAVMTPYELLELLAYSGD